jgi:ketosteroid isomerase-like protein
MSQENVEILRRAVDAFDRGDRTAWLALLDEDYVITPAADWPGAREIRGGEAGWEFYRDVAQTLDFERSRIEFTDAGRDKVVAHQRNEGRGHASGAAVELDYWIVATFRDGKILRNEWFTDHAETLEAAGLRE